MMLIKSNFIAMAVVFVGLFKRNLYSSFVFIYYKMYFMNDNYMHSYLR